MSLSELITATDLKQWADTNSCRLYLPLLIRKLIRATVPSVESLSIPCGDSTHLPGWDGIVMSQSNIHNVPKGKSVWEFGCDKDYKQKAKGDLLKRTEDSRGEEIKEITFVFVTPREWQNVDVWIQEKKRDSKWKEIVVITAVELEEWLSCTPAVSLWLATFLDKLPGSGVETIDHWWNNWANGNGFSLPYSIVLGGRNEEKTKVIDACESPKHVYLEANTQAEAIAFAIASICTNDNNGLAERALVASTDEAYQDLVNHYKGLIIISTVKEPESAATERNHIIIHTSSTEDHAANAITLPVIPKDDFVNALKEIGISDKKARAYALDTIRDVNVLRRILKIEQYKPQWASAVNLPKLLPALLVGRWDSSCAGDKELLELMSGKSYRDFFNGLRMFLNVEDAPFVIIEKKIYRVRSSFEVINNVVDSISDDDLEYFSKVISQLIDDTDADAVASMTDSGFHLRQHNQKYSHTIREGVFQTLALFSLFGQQNSMIKDFADNQMRMINEKMDLQVYLSNKSFLNLIAEASPERFLSNVEKEIKNGSKLMSKLFEYRPKMYSIVGGDIYYSELLWSLESIAWSPEYLLRVTNILIYLNQYPHNNHYVNSPYNSLKSIFRPFLPQTSVSYNQRLSVLQQAKDKNPEVCFKLCVDLLNSVRDHACFCESRQFRWRQCEDKRGCERLGYFVQEYIDGLVSIALSCTNEEVRNIQELIPISTNKNLGKARNIIVNYICNKEALLIGNNDFINALRHEITRQKQCAGTDWALTRYQLKPFESLYDAVESKDVLEKYRWMFDEDFIQLPEKRDYGTKHLQHVLNIRTNAVQQIIDQKGKSAFWELVNIAKCPSSLSECLIAISGYADLEAVYAKFCRKTIPQAFAMNYFKRLFYKFGIDQYLEKFDILKTIDESCLCEFLYAPGYNVKIWDYIQTNGVTMSESYWKNVDIFYIDDDPEPMLDQLCNVERYKDVLHLINWDCRNHDISETKILSILQSMIDKKKFEEIIERINDVSDIIESLDKSDNPVIQKALVPMEFLLFDHIHRRRNQHEMQFIKAITHDPSLMIQLIEMVYKKDEDAPEEQLSEEEMHYLANAQRLAYTVFFNLHVPPCLKDDNTIDEEELKNYIDRLLRFAKERHIVNSTYSVIGELLGNIPFGEDYPPRYLCEIVESMEDSEKVGRGLSRQLFNRHGFTSRSYNEGGTIERCRVAKYEEYKKKVMFEYPTMAEVFDDLIKDYERQGQKEDFQATMLDLDN